MLDSETLEAPSIPVSPLFTLRYFEAYLVVAYDHRSVAPIYLELSIQEAGDGIARHMPVDISVVVIVANSIVNQPVEETLLEPRASMNFLSASQYQNAKTIAKRTIVFTVCCDSTGWNPECAEALSGIILVPIIS
jgi:hypothetical protein